MSNYSICDFVQFGWKEGYFLSGLFILFLNSIWLGINNILVEKTEKGEINQKKEKELCLGGKDSYFEVEHIESVDSFLASCDFWSIWNTPGAEKALFLLPKDKKKPQHNSRADKRGDVELHKERF